MVKLEATAVGEKVSSVYAKNELGGEVSGPQVN